jgi:hypothetical protein
LKYAAYTLPSTIVAALVSNIVLKNHFWKEKMGIAGFSMLTISFYGFLMKQGFLGKFLFGLASIGVVGGMLYRK